MATTQTKTETKIEKMLEDAETRIDEIYAELNGPDLTDAREDELVAELANVVKRKNLARFALGKS